MSKAEEGVARPPPVEEDANRWTKILLAGALAGAVSRTITAPIDRLKMILQVQVGQPRSLKWGLQRMAAEGSLKSYFKGNGTNVVKIAPETAIKLTGSDVLKAYLVHDHDDIQPQERFLCGALAGATAQFSIYPMELIRTRLAICQTGTYRGIFHAATQILRQEGWQRFYRGLTPSTMGIVPYAGVDIATFEMLMEHLAEAYDGVPPDPLIVGAGMCSSVFAQFVSYPLAVTRTRLQYDGIGGKALKYNGMVDVLYKTMRDEGFRGLYKGLLPNLIKLAPAAGISWFVFEKTKQFFGLNGRY